MPLPKNSHPLYDLIIPSNNKKIKVRPMLTKEEKLLLLARESSGEDDILNAVKQVVNNCIIDDAIDIDKLATFDIEFFFLKLRSLSINNITKYSVIDNADNKVYTIEINLDDVIVKFPESIEKNIKISDDSGILMKYPEASLFSDEEFSKLAGLVRFEEYTYRCIDKLYFGDEVFIFSDVSKADREEFMETLSIKDTNKIRDFLNDMPSLYYKGTYKNSEGTEREIVLTSLTDFFTL